MTADTSVPDPVVIVGGGPAGLFAAWEIASAGRPARVYEQMRGFGRKLLVAGHGGLNLTHTGDLDRFLDRFGEARPFLERGIAEFTPDDLRAWVARLGIPTFVGSSGRIFPEGLKAGKLLRAWLMELRRLGVELLPRHRWLGWGAEGALRIEAPDARVLEVHAPACILALGGASWPHLGSDARWVPVFEGASIGVRPLRASNCGFEIAWSARLVERCEGAPLKGMRWSAGGRSSRAECVVTRWGLEGGGVYELGPALRDELDARGEALLHVDLKPGLPLDEVAARLARHRGKLSWSNFLRRTLGLAPAAIALLHESGARPLFGDTPALAARVKDLTLRLTATRPIEEAISTAGGVRLDELDAHLMLRRRPGVFLAGEMLDWDAPTGGYLLHASLATGRAAARGALAWLANPHGSSRDPALEQDADPV